MPIGEKWMDRREFLAAAGAASLAAALNPPLAFAAARGDYGNLLVLVELQGGNDGLNTVVPYADSTYYRLRPQLAIARDQVLRLDDASGLHPALRPLLPLWQQRELAIVRSIGYPDANLSHFRSIEIWDTASKSNEYLREGWLARTFRQAQIPGTFAADGKGIGGVERELYSENGTRVIALGNSGQLLRRPSLVGPAQQAGNAVRPPDLALRSEFPSSAFGNAARMAVQRVASETGITVLKIAFNGFDTHADQRATHARLLGDLAEGLAALRQALIEIGRWNSALILTYSEFGRRPRQNHSGGTDHGTANAHFVLGGRVRGGLYGPPPALDRLDGNGNLPFAVDFRDLYATVLDRWWGVDSVATLGGRYRPLDLLRA
jgi:uncharacterized protein (DUF1501 family)